MQKKFTKSIIPLTRIIKYGSPTRSKDFIKRNEKKKGIFVPTSCEGKTGSKRAENTAEKRNKFSPRLV